MKAKISVIMPTYNVEGFIESSINSIINQTLGFENIELIIVDDCSTDNTKQIIMNYVNKYDNIIPLFLESNNGAPGAPRNCGINVASADYIMFIDSDDYYLPKMCEKLYNTITKYDVDVVACNVYFNPKHKTDFPSFFYKYGDVIKIDNINDSPNLMESSLLLWMWNKIYRKKVILDNNISFLENIRNEDVYFSVKYNLFAKGIIILPKFDGYGYAVRSEGESASVTFDKKHFVENSIGILKILELLNLEKADYSNVEAKLLLGWIKWFLFTNLSTEKYCQKFFLDRYYSYFKNYKITTRIHMISFFYNVFINLSFKLFGLNKYFMILGYYIFKIVRN